MKGQSVWGIKLGYGELVGKLDVINFTSGFHFVSTSTTSELQVSLSAAACADHFNLVGYCVLLISPAEWFGHVQVLFIFGVGEEDQSNSVDLDRTSIHRAFNVSMRTRVTSVSDG